MLEERDAARHWLGTGINGAVAGDKSDFCDEIESKGVEEVEVCGIAEACHGV